MKFLPLLRAPRLRVTLGTASIVLVCAGLALYLFPPLPDVVVTRTPNGFIPSKVTIRKGQAVVFRSTAGDDFWPASDAHPSHALYPEFDPKHALPPDASWRMVFTKAGIWSYHDHLQEFVRGSVTVLGKPGETTKNCLTQTDKGNPTTRGYCWAAQITEVLRASGLQAAFDEFARIYAEQADFKGLACHDATHVLGSEAYKAYAANHTVIDRPETSFCGYGFYHGFIETMLLESGPGQFTEVTDYCRALKTKGVMNNAAGACYHGIGHAVFDTLPGTIWGDAYRMTRSALDACELAVKDPAERSQCGSGVFNSLAIAESRHLYNMTFDQTDPLGVCERQPDEYRKGCYGEMGIGTIREFQYDRSQALKFIAAIKNKKDASTVLEAYAGDEAVRTIASPDLSDLRSLCASFPTEMARRCDKGVLFGMRQAGIPGTEYANMFAYCKALTDDARKACIDHTVIQARPLAKNPDDFMNTCVEAAGPEYATRCKPSRQITQ